MKFVHGILMGALMTAGVFLVKGKLFPEMPEVLATSVFPDSRWIYEIVDIHPRGPVCQILIHAQAYEGYTKLERGYSGECFAMDLDSSGLSSGDVRFRWNGPEMTVEARSIGEVRLRCSDDGTKIVSDPDVVK